MPSPPDGGGLISLPVRHGHFAKYREWQWIKHTFLADYLVPWSQMLGSFNNQIYVVDAFAGAGSHTGPGGELIPGSPIIAGQTAIEYQSKKRWANCSTTWTACMPTTAQSS